MQNVHHDPVVHLTSIVNLTDAIGWGVRVHVRDKSSASEHAIGGVD
jgi:hypothetical protein